MSGNLRFRDAEPADVPVVVALVQSAYRGEASRAGWTTEADFLDGQRVDAAGVADAIAMPRSAVLLARRCDQPADAVEACAHVACIDGDGYFGMFAVRPGLQGEGIGGRMLAEAERRAAADWGCTRMGMTVIDLRDELIAWYARRGYARSGQYKPFPYGDERFGIPRRGDLRFEWLYKDLGGAT